MNHLVAEFYTESPIGILNDDCLERIFFHVPTIRERMRLEQVCKRWQAVLLGTWRSVRILDVTRRTALDWGLPPGSLARRLTPAGLRKILRCCGNRLLEVDSSDSRQLSRSILESSAEFCPNLTTARLRSCSWPHLDPQTSLGACASLTKFEISHADDESLLAKLFPMLRHLKQLKIHGDPVNSTVGHCLLNLSETVEEIQLLNVTIINPNFEMGLSKLPRLRSLGLENCSNVDAETFSAISKRKSIRELKIRGYHLIPSIARTVSLIPELGNLETLEFTTMNRGFMRSISQAGLRSAAVGSMWRSISIDDGLLDGIARCCRKLRSLDISGSTAVTDEGLSRLAAATSLERLLINFLVEVTDSCLAGLTNLRTLQSVGCAGIGDGGVIALLENAPRLEVLDVSLTSITDKTLEAALRVTKLRTNNLILNVAAAHTSALPFSNEDSQLLNVIDDTLFAVI